MKFATVTDLKQKATQIVSEIERTKEELIITKKGHPVVLMKPIEAKDFTLKDESKGVNK